MASPLMLHAGARLIERSALDAVEAPAPTDTWFPIRHSCVLDTTIDTLGKAGFAVKRQQLALSRTDSRFFATLDLEAPVAAGVSLAVGIRNSIDKSLPISFCAGNRVFVCDNLAFRSELVVARKHTKFGALRFGEAISRAVGTLTAFQQKERERIVRFQEHALTDETAEALMLRSYEQGIVSPRLLPRVIEAWRKPPFEEFSPRTLWSLENCFTGVLGEVQKTNPQRFAALTIRLQALLGGDSPASETVLSTSA